MYIELVRRFLTDNMCLYVHVFFPVRNYSLKMWYDFNTNLLRKSLIQIPYRWYVSKANVMELDKACRFLFDLHSDQASVL